MPEPENAIDLTSVPLAEQSYEVMRVWITNNAGSSVFINAALINDPQLFGRLMGNTIRHAAKAYAAKWKLEEDAALQAIVDGTTTELRNQSSQIKQTDPGSLN